MPSRSVAAAARAGGGGRACALRVVGRPDGTEVRLSYAHPDDRLIKRVAIRTVERVTGQPRLRRLYLENRRQPRAGESFFEAAVRLLRLRLVYEDARLAEAPAQGPLVVVANHPYGVLDGIVLACLIGRLRPDLRILANSVLLRAPEMQDVMLPIDFGPGAEALRTNLASRAAAEDWLEAGGCVLVFPGGGVSTVPRPFDRLALDAEWHPFVARLIQRARAPVLPVFFAGQNSRLFQIASHVSLTLRLSLLFKEVADRIGGELRLAIGAPLTFAQLAPLAERRALMAELRRRTYALECELPPIVRRWPPGRDARAPAALDRSVDRCTPRSIA